MRARLGGILASLAALCASGCFVEYGGGGCRADRDCPAGWFCDVDGRCSPDACTSDRDCPVGSTCDVRDGLCYLDDAGMVMGTRTTRQMVEQGANMRFLLRWGNVFMAKFLQVCWLRPSEPRFTDVGCTFRALTRETWQRIRKRTREPGPAFSPEMMCAALQERCRVIEVPVTYARRMGGESKHSDTFRRQARLAFKMFRTICRKRFLERGAPIPKAETQQA